MKSGDGLGLVLGLGLRLGLGIQNLKKKKIIFHLFFV